MRGSAGTGRRARLRIWCSNAWGFESPLPHFDTVEAGKAISSLKVLAVSMSYPIDITPDNGVVMLSSLNDRGREVMPADIEGEVNRVRIDGKYFADTLKAFSSMVDLKLTDDKSPILFHADGTISLPCRCWPMLFRLVLCFNTVGEHLVDQTLPPAKISAILRLACQRQRLEAEIASHKKWILSIINGHIPGIRQAFFFMT